MPVSKSLLALSALVCLPVWAAPPAVVSAVQAPAWLERGGKARPLAAGMAIENGDRIRTGDDARVYLALAEGSTVKLGADARLAFFNMSSKPRREYRGALDVLTGALRFTTGDARGVKARDVIVRVGTASAAIRGTDVWARSSPDDDLICLVDGHIDVWHPTIAGSLPMAMPMTFVDVPKGQAAQPVIAADPVNFASWARQTDIARGAGASRRGGKFSLSLGRYASEGQALDQYDLIRGAGYAVSVKPVPADGEGWSYQLLVQGFADEGEAAAAAARLKAATGIDATTTR
ncbi:MAG TPA: FecR domain-containing protein [Rhodocyclaceae bacterium]